MGRAPSFLKGSLSVSIKTIAEKRYVDKTEAAAILQQLGFGKATESTISYHCYRTRKLAEPKIVNRRAYWAIDDIYKLVDAI